MEHNGKYKGPAEEINKQQVEKKLNALTPTKKNNTEIMVNDLDPQSCITEKLSNGPMDSKPDNGSDSNYPSFDVSKHSVNKNSSNTDCDTGNIKDIDLPTTITENDEVENTRKIAAFVRKVLHNEIPEETMEWPLPLLIESKQSIKISQEELQNIIKTKTAEIMATNSFSARQTVNMSVCKETQRFYYKKYKQLLNNISALSSELDSMTRVPDPIPKHVRNAGTSVNMPDKNGKRTL